MLFMDTIIIGEERVFEFGMISLSSLPFPP